ncbi:MAG: NTP transferase domain-containing protein [Paludibacteraceae bacterium]|nr:NTP transferase domain-containing protein [Paludibacteraceae bacterium]
MKTVIFAAGLGTRLKPLTDTMPKALVPLAGKPLLQWQVEKLRDAGITDIIVNVHHFPDMIIDSIRANQAWGCNIMISDERNQLLDTGGGLKKMYHAQLIKPDEPILACNVDILSNIDIKALIAQYEKAGISQVVVSDRQTQRYLLFDEQNYLCGWTNIATGEIKPSSIRQSIIPSLRKLAFSGMQILGPEVLEYLKEMKEEKFSLIPFYLQIMDRVNLQAYIPSDYRMMDVGKIDQISEAEAFAESLQ